MSSPTRDPALCPHGPAPGAGDSLLRELKARAAACPDAVAMAYHGRRLSYQAVLDASLSLAAGIAPAPVNAPPCAAFPDLFNPTLVEYQP
ncbi:hypothetical protein CNECB9_5360002 [Cupriavidus necator]|uniref:AMP-dependent synthetase/ligase domain-containing protein n=1 Tax=Cupriavidus necator TaxID=106590 RepID=A0A1K0IQ49_CUPNE|nr:hypothetical protein CNECB9_5360002 [Cupriavidus necator]